MLNNTYIHIPGVGKSLERKIWAQGINTWEEFLEHKDRIPIPSARKARISEEIRKSSAHLAAKRLLFFFTMPSFYGTLESVSYFFRFHGIFRY